MRSAWWRWWGDIERPWGVDGVETGHISPVPDLNMCGKKDVAFNVLVHQWIESSDALVEAVIALTAFSLGRLWQAELGSRTRSPVVASSVHSCATETYRGPAHGPWEAANPGSRKEPRPAS